MTAETSRAHTHTLDAREALVKTHTLTHTHFAKLLFCMFMGYCVFRGGSASRL